MTELLIENRKYLTSELFNKSGLKAHGFTGSQGGVSYGKITGLNLGFRVDDDTESVYENYRLVAKDLGFDLSRAVLSKQTHTDNIRVVTEADAGKGITKISDIEDTDGLITNAENIPLVVFSADCTPVLLYDPVERVVGAVHSGWRGTIKHIGAGAVELMQKTYNCRPENILGAIGPSIGPCCFEFSKSDADVFPKEYHIHKNGEKILVDLWRMNRDILIQSGVPTENIDMSEVCTFCRSDEYYSFRKHKDNTGRQGAIIML